MTWYEKFVANPPGKLQTEIDEAKKRLEELTKKPKLHIESTPSSALILVDGKVVGLTPQDVDVTPGKHLVHIELAGYESIDKDVDASEKDVRAKLEKRAEPAVVTLPEEKPVDTTSTTTPNATPDAPKSVKPPTVIPAIITGGLGAVALGIGIGFGAAALGNKSDFDTNPNAASADAGRTNAVACEVFIGAAITLVVTSTILFLSKGSSEKPQTAIRF